MRGSFIAAVAAVAVVALGPAVQQCAVATPLLGNSMGDIGGAPAALFDIDPATGVASNPRSLGVTSLVGIAYGPGGTLYGLMTFAGTYGNSLVRIDPVTGATTLVGPTGFSNIFEGDIAYNPANGLLYGIEDVPGGGNVRNLFTIDPATGRGTVIRDLGFGGDPSALAFSPGGTLYVLNNVDDGPPDQLYVVDPATGIPSSPVNLSSRLGFTEGMAFDPATGILYVADGGDQGSNSLYTVNPATGAMTRVGGLGQLAPRGLSGLTFLPEPAALGALLAAGGGLLSRRTRRRR